ncbi:MAG: hypothetical protein KA807_19810 [Prolixibacteraceae bacterium]|nr:hypothetical protein [Prolixibacteraceae bacterium]
MLNILKNIFSKKREMPNEDVMLHQETSSPNLSPITQLRHAIKDIGHTEYPFLHKEYSPNSRVPCIDFTPFIIERLKAKDTLSIYTLMKGIIQANPGVGIGDDWICRRIDNVLSVNFTNYLHFKEEAALYELKAMWIMAEKDGGGRAFWLTTDFPLFFARALCSFPVEIQPTMEDLLQKANEFIQTMRKDTDYWKEYPLFQAEYLHGVDSYKHLCPPILLPLSISARLHLFSVIELGGGSLPNLTSYKLRNFGINIKETSKALLDHGLVIKTVEDDIVRNCFSKNELLGFCEEYQLDYKKSWKKEKLFEAIKQQASHLIEQKIEEMQIVSIHPQYKDDLMALYTYSQALEPIYKLLCFA